MNLYAAIDATWPAAKVHRRGPWAIREGAGGGNRVSAASQEAEWSDADIGVAEAAQVALGQEPLFMVRDGEQRLDQALAARGYLIRDPVTLYAAPVAQMAAVPPKPMTTFPHWPMLEILRDIWADGGIGPGRIAVMERAEAPKCVILGRINDRAAGVAFIACHGETAMLHALHVVSEQRRNGIAVHIMRAAAAWAQDVGATQISVVVTDANKAANALYASLGMQIVGHYHYRVK